MRNKKKASARTLRKWKEDIRFGGILTRWVTAAVRYIAKFRKPHIRKEKHTQKLIKSVYMTIQCVFYKYVHKPPVNLLYEHISSFPQVRLADTLASEFQVLILENVI
jgi:ABC-type ATPase with predicted acetyltransferase domain